MLLCKTIFFYKKSVNFFLFIDKNHQYKQFLNDPQDKIQCYNKKVDLNHL